MILITGSASGIGEFLFQKFKDAGEDVIGTWHNRPKMEGVRIDVTDEEEVENLAAKYKVDEIIHCAGITKNALIHNLDSKDWQKVLETNLQSSFLISKYFLPYMQENNYGRIIFISSIVPQVGVPGTSPYSASKAALWGLAKTIAHENAKKNVTCNCLNLGYFDIGMIKEVPEKFLSQIVEKIPMRKLGDPENIYNAIKFIIKSDYLTGTCIDINGGLA